MLTEAIAATALAEKKVVLAAAYAEGLAHDSKSVFQEELLLSAGAETARVKQALKPTAVKLMKQFLRRKQNAYFKACIDTWQEMIRSLILCRHDHLILTTSP